MHQLFGMIQNLSLTWDTHWGVLDLQFVPGWQIMKSLCDGCGHTFILRLAVGEIYLPHFVHGINDIPVFSYHVHTYHIACRCFARLLFISVFLTFRLVECTAGFTGDKFKSSKGDCYWVGFKLNCNQNLTWLNTTLCIFFFGGDNMKINNTGQWYWFSRF